MASVCPVLRTRDSKGVTSEVHRRKEVLETQPAKRSVTKQAEKKQRTWQPSSEDASNNKEALDTLPATICVNQLNRESSVCVNNCPCLVERNRYVSGINDEIITGSTLVANHKRKL